VCVFEALEREWRRLGVDRVAARQMGDVCFLAGGARSLVEVERFVRQAPPAEADRVLLALVNRAVVGDTLAARVLLQLLLPGTRRLARRWWALGDHEERAAAAVTAVWQRICAYPVARRPGRVAANVLMDAARELRRAVPAVVTVPSPDPRPGLARRPGTRGTRAAGRAGDAAAGAGVGGAAGVPGAGGDAGEDGEAGVVLHPAVELAEVLADAVRDGIVDVEDAKLIARSRIAGERVADLAARRGLRPRTLWDRRQRAESALVAAHSTN
jgi:hypothetical protein